MILRHLVIVIVVFVPLIVFLFKWEKKRKMKKQMEFLQLLNEHGLTFSEMTRYFCKYVGGHPERDEESRENIFFGVKNEKLIFFDGYSSNGYYSGGMEGNMSTKVKIESDSTLKHLFDIPIKSITDIRYFDATTSSTAALVGGSNWAIPIRMKQGDASVLIDWNDGNFNHSTEFRFEGTQANKRANTLRNKFIKMTKN